ncbi:hypothetical protein KAS50_07440 [bacterium]|nr:hypothetical protein [bacterium]
MTIEEAIKTAINYEVKIRDLYKENSDRLNNPVAKKIFKVLADEERLHVEYLKNSLNEWKKSGIVNTKTLETIVPDKDAVEAGIQKLKKEDAEYDIKEEMEIFKKVLKLEIESTNFYKNMIKDFPEESQANFARLIEIEEGHEMIIQAEIDHANKLGFWFDFMEFDLEAG